jgi:uncharacterized iron-regulated protein
MFDNVFGMCNTMTMTEGIAMSDTKTQIIAIRVTPETKQNFKQVIQQYDGDPATIMRDIIQALIDGRLSIEPPTNQKASLYVTRN